jgi:hypothetical protein
MRQFVHSTARSDHSAGASRLPFAGARIVDPDRAGGREREIRIKRHDITGLCRS